MNNILQYFDQVDKALDSLKERIERQAVLIEQAHAMATKAPRRICGHMLDTDFCHLTLNHEGDHHV